MKMRKNSTFVDANQRVIMCADSNKAINLETSRPLNGMRRFSMSLLGRHTTKLHPEAASWKTN